MLNKYSEARQIIVYLPVTLTLFNSLFYKLIFKITTPAHLKLSRATGQSFVYCNIWKDLYNVQSCESDIPRMLIKE